MDISDGGQEVISFTVSNFLQNDMKVPADQVTAVLGQDNRVLRALLPSLGIRSSSVDCEPESSHTKLANGIHGTQDAAAAEPVYITNVPEFKARLAVSAGPSPVVDLSEFEDLESKL